MPFLPYRFDLQLEDFGVAVDKLSTNAIPDHLFQAWLEDWEVPLLKNYDSVAEAKLKVQYQYLVFCD